MYRIFVLLSLLQFEQRSSLNLSLNYCVIWIRDRYDVIKQVFRVSFSRLTGSSAGSFSSGGCFFLSGCIQAPSSHMRTLVWPRLLPFPLHQYLFSLLSVCFLTLVWNKNVISSCRKTREMIWIRFKVSLQSPGRSFTLVSAESWTPCSRAGRRPGPGRRRRSRGYGGCPC